MLSSPLNLVHPDIDADYLLAPSSTPSLSPSAYVRRTPTASSPVEPDWSPNLRSNISQSTNFSGPNFAINSISLIHQHLPAFLVNLFTNLSLVLSPTEIPHSLRIQLVRALQSLCFYQILPNFPTHIRFAHPITISFLRPQAFLVRLRHSIASLYSMLTLPRFFFVTPIIGLHEFRKCIALR